MKCLITLITAFLFLGCTEDLTNENLPNSNSENSTTPSEDTVSIADIQGTWRFVEEHNRFDTLSYTKVVAPYHSEIIRISGDSVITYKYYNSLYNTSDFHENITTETVSYSEYPELYNQIITQKGNRITFHNDGYRGCQTRTFESYTGDYLQDFESLHSMYNKLDEEYHLSSEFWGTWYLSRDYFSHIALDYNNEIVENTRDKVYSNPQESPYVYVINEAAVILYYKDFTNNTVTPHAYPHSYFFDTKFPRTNADGDKRSINVVEYNGRVVDSTFYSATIETEEYIQLHNFEIPDEWGW